MREPLLDKLDRKIGRFALRRLMTIIVVGTAIVWLLDYVVWLRSGISISYYIRFDKQAILRGEVWRVITFIFDMTGESPFTLLLSLYFYWFIGSALERQWGAFKFDLFYFCGVLGTIGGGFIAGSATVYYLNLSLFLAFALLYPNHMVLLFFFIPIKMKWLAIIDLAFLLFLLIFNNLAGRLAIGVALINITIFFVGGLIRKWLAYRRKKKWQSGIRIVEDVPKEKKKKKVDDDPFEL